jgi:glycosyltransferase involved in cell wall biosynthesis
MKIFIVIPFYNEEKHIGAVVRSIAKYKLPAILVDDGSSDRSQLLIKNLKFKNLTLLTHRVNLGKGAAMKTGADFAFGQGADAVIFMDGDNQHKAEDLPKFVKALKSGKYNVIFGTRNYSYGVPLVRYLGNKFASLILVAFFHIFVTDVLCGFKGVTKEAYEKIRWDSAGYGVETEIVARVGKKRLHFCEIPVQSIYHDKTKGVTIMDAFGIMGEIVKWRVTI